jgi:hypothetical protein
MDFDGEHKNNEDEKERKKTRTTEKHPSNIPFRKQKLKEEIAAMINNLKEKDVYSEELMWKSRKRKDGNLDTSEHSSLRQVF